MVRTTFSEAIKANASTIKNIVEEDFANTVCSDDKPKFYNRYKNPHDPDGYTGLDDMRLKDIDDKRIPDWVYNEEYTDEEKVLLQNLHDELFWQFQDEYRDDWDELVQQYYENRKADAEKELGTDERHEKYLKEKAAYESGRDNYYGWCMNGGGGRKAFRRMYGDGDFISYGGWLIENYGKN